MERYQKKFNEDKEQDAMEMFKEALSNLEKCTRLLEKASKLADIDKKISDNFHFELKRFIDIIKKLKIKM
jgi:hypothetical protein